jgi:DNA-binding HxlR family transcriptional regulator
VIEIRGGILSRRWAPEILLALEQPKRFNRILERLEPCSDRMLSVRLRDLEEAGLLVRIVDAGPPVKVEYQLTFAGERYLPVLKQLKAIEARVDQEVAVG